MSLKSRVFSYLTKRTLDGEATVRELREVAPTEYRELPKRFHGLRVKYERDGTPKLNFSGKGPWLTLEEAYQSYLSEMREKLRDSLAKVLEFDPDTLVNLIIFDSEDRKSVV